MGGGALRILHVFGTSLPHTAPWSFSLIIRGQATEKGGKKPVAPTLPVLLHCVLQLQKNNSTSPCNLQIPTFSYLACSFAYPTTIWIFGFLCLKLRTLGNPGQTPAIYSKYILPNFRAVGFASSISWQHLCTALPIFVPMCIDRIPFWRPWTYLDNWNPAFSRVQSGGENGTAESSSGLLLDLSDCGRAKEHLEEAQVPVRLFKDSDLALESWGGCKTARLKYVWSLASMSFVWDCNLFFPKHKNNLSTHSVISFHF